MMQRSSLASPGPPLSLQHPWTITPNAVVNSQQEAALEHCAGKKIELNFKEIKSLGISRAAPNRSWPWMKHMRDTFAEEVYSLVEKNISNSTRDVPKNIK